MEEEVQCKKLADAAMRDLASAMPALDEAVKVSLLLANIKVMRVSLVVFNAFAMLVQLDLKQY